MSDVGGEINVKTRKRTTLKPRKRSKSSKKKSKNGAKRTSSSRRRSSRKSKKKRKRRKSNHRKPQQVSASSSSASSERDASTSTSESSDSKTKTKATRKHQRKQRRRSRHGPKVHKFSSSAQASLGTAIRNGDTNAVVALLHSGKVDPNKVGLSVDDAHEDHGRQRGEYDSDSDEYDDYADDQAEYVKRSKLLPLHEAVLYRSNQRAREHMFVSLLQHKADIEGVDGNGNTALHVATKLKDHSLVGMLLEKGADDLRENNRDQTAYSLGSANLLLRYEREASTAARERKLRQDMESLHRQMEQEKAMEEARWREKIREAGSTGLGGDGGGDAYDQILQQESWAKQWETDERRAQEWGQQHVDSLDEKKARAHFRKSKQRHRKDKAPRSQSRSGGENQQTPATGSPKPHTTGDPGSARAGPLPKGWKQGEQAREPQKPHKPPLRRDDVTSSELAAQREEMGNNFSAFEESMKQKATKLSSPTQFPWPTGPPDNMFALPRIEVMTCAERKKIIRMLQLRWHPDKVQQKWGRRWEGSDEDWESKVLGRVRGISQAVNALKAKFAEFEEQG